MLCRSALPLLLLLLPPWLLPLLAAVEVGLLLCCPLRVAPGAVAWEAPCDARLRAGLAGAVAAAAGFQAAGPPSAALQGSSGRCQGRALLPC